MSFYTIRPITDYTIFNTPAGAHKPIQFSAKWSDTEQLLRKELDHLKATDTLLEIGVNASDIRLDGRLRANARPEHPGVRLSFQTKHHGPLSYTCDTYRGRGAHQMEDWQANVRAIALTLESLRRIDRYGATKGEQYAGFKAIGAGTGDGIALGGMTRDEAASVLSEWSGVTITAGESEQSVRARWRAARAAAHPDRNDGNRGAWDQVEQAAQVMGVTR